MTLGLAAFPVLVRKNTEQHDARGMLPAMRDPCCPPDRIGQAWSRYCKELDVKARLHDLRHLQASMLLDAGEAVTAVAARLGHRDTATTLKVYSHLMPGADTRAASVVGSALQRGEKS